VSVWGQKGVTKITQSIKNEIMKVHRLTSSSMAEREYVEKQSDNETLVMFVTSDGEDTARNISKWYKIM
jgi:hypothetical protein